jgi:hypothetical protein
MRAHYFRITAHAVVIVTELMENRNVRQCFLISIRFGYDADLRWRGDKHV